MTTTSIVFGVILILIGIGGYLYGMTTGHASLTALIPAAFGVVIAALGAIGNAKEDLRKHLMHAAVLLGLVGFILPLGRVLSKLSEFAISAAVMSQLAMSAVCLVFVVLAVRSFVEARRNS